MTVNTSKRTPKLRKQKRNGRPDLAYVELVGQSHYLGSWGSPEAREYYVVFPE